MTSKKLVAVLLLSVSGLVSVVKSACPDEEDIEPCTCQGEGRKTVLRCSSIRQSSVLEKVAQNSDGYKYDEVHIEASSLHYIPKVVLETIRTRNLTLRNLTLTRFVDSIPNSLEELTIVQLKNIKVLNGLSWAVFNNTPGLEFLIIEHVNIPVIKAEFNKYVSHKMRALRLDYTGTKEIAKGAFKDFQKLGSLSLSNNNLKSVRRDSFPDPFNIQMLALENNKLTTIPDDFFSGWPWSSNVFLNGNLISRINEAAFNITNSNIVDLSNNPIKCDCYLKWIANRRNIFGTCAAPKRMMGKSLPDLSQFDFDC